MSQAVTQTTTGAAGDGQRPRGDRLMAAPTIQQRRPFSDWPIAAGDDVGPRAAPDARAYYARESLDGGPMRPAAGGASAPVVGGAVR